MAAEAGVKTLVLTHLGPYTSTAAAVEMAGMYYGPRRDDSIWEEIVAAAAKHFKGRIILGCDALVLDVPAGEEPR